MTTNALMGFHPKYGIAMLTKIRKTFGLQFFLLIVSVYFAMVGVIRYNVQNIQLPYYQAANVSGQVQAEMNSISKIPWATKGFIGVLSDLFPIGGRNKYWYLLIFLALGIACHTTLAFLPLTIVHDFPPIAGTLFFGINVCSAAFDLLMEAKNIELLQKNPHVKGDLITFAWFFETVGLLVPSLLVGVISDHFDVRVNFYIFFPMIFIPLPPILMGGVIDDFLPPGTRGTFNKERFTDQAPLIVLTTLQATFTVFTVLMTFFTNSTVQLSFLIGASFFLIVLAYIYLDRMVAHFNLFTYLNYSLYVNLQGALEYYYTAKEPCVIDGPQFSYTVMNTLSPTFFTIAQFLAIFAFQVLLKHWQFRTVLWGTTALRMCSALADVSLVNRWNRAIYVPDVVMFILGYSTVSQLAAILDTLATVYLMARVCPKRYEATMFAFLAGLFHFGKTSAIQIGVFLMDLFNIQTQHIPEENVFCNYNNLNLLILIGHAILPGITLPLAFYLLPTTRMSDAISGDYSNSNDNKQPPNFKAVNVEFNNSDYNKKYNTTTIDTILS